MICVVRRCLLCRDRDYRWGTSQGGSYLGDGVKTDTLVVRGLTGTVRQIIATHSMDKLHHFSAIKY